MLQLYGSSFSKPKKIQKFFILPEQNLSTKVRSVRHGPNSIEDEIENKLRATKNHGIYQKENCASGSHTKATCC